MTIGEECPVCRHAMRAMFALDFRTLRAWIWWVCDDHGETDMMLLPSDLGATLATVSTYGGNGLQPHRVEGTPAHDLSR